ncbi:ATPase domain-containing protein [Thermococcus sp. JCM 11816]|uniref:ATPase domain-containing protein n=1 Tax=Thermococcus sp. (strain JCM 11816 / KS-1) TaxID=1295125 RepID=UPI000AAD7265
MDITTLLLSEMLSSEKYTDEYYLADGVIVLHHFMRNYQMVRAIQILKMRGRAPRQQPQEDALHERGHIRLQGGSNMSDKKQLVKEAYSFGYFIG